MGSDHWSEISLSKLALLLTLLQYISAKIQTKSSRRHKKNKQNVRFRNKIVSFALKSEKLGVSKVYTCFAEELPLRNARTVDFKFPNM
jgi:hypothetical protein